MLLAAGLGRFLIALGHAQVLCLPDPAVALPLRWAILIVGGMEIAVALICLFGKSVWLQVAWQAWLASEFLIVYVGLLFSSRGAQGTCIGSLTDPLHLSRGIVGIMVAMCPFYLLFGSYGTLAWLWIGRAKGPVKEFSKMSCPSCGTHIRFTFQDLGRMIHCSHCQTALTLRKSGENLKMSCYFCKEHIEFPAHAVGHKMACPHCKMDITLKEQTA